MSARECRFVLKRLLVPQAEYELTSREEARMSTKVVHLSTDAHTMAKEYCKARGLKMSDWVANLIRGAVSETRKETVVNNVRDLVPKKNGAGNNPTPQVDENGTPAWAQPPFWQRAKG